MMPLHEQPTLQATVYAAPNPPHTHTIQTNQPPIPKPPRNTDALFTEWKAPIYRPTHIRAKTAEPAVHRSDPPNRNPPSPPRSSMRPISVVDESLVPAPLRLKTSITKMAGVDVQSAKEYECIPVATIDTNGVIRTSEDTINSAGSTLDLDARACETGIYQPNTLHLLADTTPRDYPDTVIYFLPLLSPIADSPIRSESSNVSPIADSPVRGKAPFLILPKEWKDWKEIGIDGSEPSTPLARTRRDNKANRVLGREDGFDERVVWAIDTHHPKRPTNHTQRNPSTSSEPVQQLRHHHYVHTPTTRNESHISSHIKIEHIDDYDAYQHDTNPEPLFEKEVEMKKKKPGKLARFVGKYTKHAESL